MGVIDNDVVERIINTFFQDWLIVDIRFDFLPEINFIKEMLNFRTILVGNGVIKAKWYVSILAFGLEDHSINVNANCFDRTNINIGTFEIRIWANNLFETFDILNKIKKIGVIFNFLAKIFEFLSKKTQKTKIFAKENYTLHIK